MVFFGRFVSVLRAYAAFLAGTMRMRYRRFLFFNASGGLIWAAVYTAAAFAAGATLRRISAPIDIVIGVLAAGVLVAMVIVLRRRFKELEPAAEEMFPGPLDR